MPSQFGQDQLVLELLGYPRGGFFLDSGAADGLRVSNTYRLETEFAWQGICVEPQDAFYSALVKNRRCLCLNCCLYDRDGDVDFMEASTLSGIYEAYQPSYEAYQPSVLKFTRENVPVARDAEGRPATVVKPVRTLGSILREYQAPRVIDYWSLDTEGSELAILRSFPFDDFQIRVLTVEHNRQPVRQEIQTLLTAHGYRRIREMVIDDCYILPSLVLPSVGPWRSRAWSRVRSPV